ncbi:MAG TPA: DUF1573 domain-containing protein [Bacteroidetes bacterium]|nr:DUF1573 domain-containing protein [Bacteroidota bacterium]
MKKLLSFLAFALFATMTFAQDATPAAGGDAGAAADGPKMEFETTEIDYGTIEQGSDPLRIFKFTNVGDEPLIISKAKGSCGCTVPKYAQEPVLPGETSEIEVRYDTKRVGPFQKTVTLTTNESTPTHVLKIKGKVNPKPVEESVPASTGGFGKN